MRRAAVLARHLAGGPALGGGLSSQRAAGSASALSALSAIQLLWEVGDADSLLHPLQALKGCAERLEVSEAQLAALLDICRARLHGDVGVWALAAVLRCGYDVVVTEEQLGAVPDAAGAGALAAVGAAMGPESSERLCERFARLAAATPVGSLDALALPGALRGALFCAVNEPLLHVARGAASPEELGAVMGGMHSEAVEQKCGAIGLLLLHEGELRGIPVALVGLVTPYSPLHSPLTHALSLEITADGVRADRARAVFAITCNALPGSLANAAFAAELVRASGDEEGLDGPAAVALSRWLDVGALTSQELPALAVELAKWYPDDVERTAHLCGRLRQAALKTPTLGDVAAVAGPCLMALLRCGGYERPETRLLESDLDKTVEAGDRAAVEAFLLSLDLPQFVFYWGRWLPGDERVLPLAITGEDQGEAVCLQLLQEHGSALAAGHFLRALVEGFPSAVSAARLARGVGAVLTRLGRDRESQAVALLCAEDLAARWGELPASEARLVAYVLFSTLQWVADEALEGVMATVQARLLSPAPPEQRVALLELLKTVLQQNCGPARQAELAVWYCSCCAQP